MPEETLFAFERNMTTAEVAEYLRTVADRLDAGEEFTLESGVESVTLTPPSRIEVERETSDSGGSGEIELEFELERKEHTAHTGDLAIE